MLIPLNLEPLLRCFRVGQVRHYNISAILLQVGKQRVIGDPESLPFIIFLEIVSFSDFDLLDALFFFQSDQLWIVCDFRLDVV